VCRTSLAVTGIVSELFLHALLQLSISPLNKEVILVFSCA
jgi:hypothetical protein